MNELQIFNNEQFGQVRTLEINNKTYFVGIDVAKILGYKDPNSAISRHCKGSVKHLVGVITGTKANGEDAIQNVMMNVISEGDIYRLTAKSELPGAEKFESWIFDEVLPSIRKHGMYAIDELLDNPDLLIKAAIQLKEERAARLEAEKQRNKLIHQGKLYTTGEIAKELNLSSATKLNNLLAEKKIQFKQNGTWLLYSKYSEMDLISIKQQQLDSGKVIYDRKWTGTGRDFILKLFNESKITA